MTGRRRDIENCTHPFGMDTARATDATPSDILFQPGRIGSLGVRNRIVMAPMTRPSLRTACPVPMSLPIVAGGRKAESD